MSNLVTAAALIVTANLSGPAQVNVSADGMIRSFGRLADGTPVELYSLATDAIELSITNYGGRIVTLETPDRDGRWGDVVPGFDSLDEYVAAKSFFGALVGRYANRIAHGHFILDGHRYQLAQYAGKNSLHGGWIGFDKRLWHGTLSGNSLQLSYIRQDPGSR